MEKNNRITDFTNLSANLNTPNSIKLLFGLRVIKSTDVTLFPYSPLSPPMQCQNDLIRYTQRIVLTEKENMPDFYELVDIVEGKRKILKFGPHITKSYGYEKIHVIRTPLNKDYFEYIIHTFVTIGDVIENENNQKLRDKFSKNFAIQEISPFKFPEEEAIPQMFGDNPISRAFNVFGNVSNLAEDTADILPKVTDSLNSFEDLMNKCSSFLDKDNISSFTSPFHEQIKKVSNSLDNMKSSVSKGMSKIVLFAAIIFHLLRKNMQSTIILLGVGVWCLTNFKEELMEIGVTIFTKISSVFSKAYPQASNSEVFSKGLITALIGILFTNVGDAGSLAGKILKQIGDFSKFSSSFESIVNFVILMFCTSMKFLSLEDYVPDNLKHFGIENDELKKYINDVDEIIARINSKRFLLSLNNYHQVKALKKKGDYICAALKTNSHDYKSLTVTLTALATVLKYLEKRVNLNDNRIEPRIYRFAGGTGNFKTQMSQHLAAHLVIATATDEERVIIGDKPMTAVYNLCEATSFADGYDMSKKVILIDDIDQFRTEVGDLDSIWAKIWAMCTELPGQTHQANLEDKGLIVWNSPFVITTTNVPIPPTEQVRDANALKRRIARAWYAYPKPEFCINPKEDNIMKMKFDTRLLPEGELGETDSHPRNLLFQPYSPIDGAYIGPPINYDKVCEAILDDYDQSRKYFAQKVVAIKETIDKADELRQKRTAQFKNADIYSEMDDFIASMDDNDIPTVIDEDEVQMEAVFQASSTEIFLRRGDNLATRLVEENPIISIQEIHDQIHEQIVDEFFRQLEADEMQMDRVNAGRIRQGENVLQAVTTIQTMQWFERFKNTIPALAGINNKSCLIAFSAAFGLDFWTKMDTYYLLYYTFEAEMLAFDINLIQAHLPVLEVEWDPNYELYLRGARNFTELQYVFFYQRYGNYAMAIVIAIRSFGFWLAFKFAIYAIKTIISFVKDLFPKVVEPQGNYENRMRKKGGEAKFLKDFTHVSVAHPQMGNVANFNGLEKVVSIVNHNQYSICLIQFDPDTGKERYSHQVFGLFLKGNVLIAPYHFKNKMLKRLETNEIDEDTMIYLIKQNFDQSRDITRTIKITTKEFLADIIENQESYDKDFCLYRLPKRVKPHRDISQCFASREALNKLCGDTFGVRVINQDRPGTGRKELFAYDCRMVSSIPISGDNPPGRGEGIRYRLPTADGDCGSPVQILSNSLALSGKIAGLHTAGIKEGTHGYSNWMTQETINDLDKLLGVVIVQEEIPFEIPEEAIYQYGKRVFLEVSPPSSSPSTTQFAPSAIFELHGPHVEKPAWLRTFINPDGILIDPRENSLVGYSPSEMLFNDIEIRVVMESVFRDIIDCSKNNYPKRLLSLEEAISGIDGEKNIDSLNMNSSPGWSTLRSRKMPGKRDWFGIDGKERSSEKYLLFVKNVNKILNDAKQGVRGFHLYADHPKDETRPNDKVDIGKTRNFSGMGLDHNVAFRIMFGTFIKFIMDNHTDNGIAVGINPYSNDWDYLGKRQSSKSGGKNCVAGDFSGFDKNQYVTIMNAMLDEINNWYDDGEENALIRRVLWFEVTHSRHIINFYVVEWVGSLPSGNTLTTIINSIYNQFSHRWCFYLINDRNFMCLQFYTKHIVTIVYGDDSHNDVDDEYADRFNELTLPVYMATLGLKYTNETKNVALKPVRTLEETSFLKRTWRYEREVCRLVAPLELSVVLHMTDWSRKGEHYISGTRDTCDIQVKELSLHGESIYKKYAPITIAAAQSELSYTPTHLSWYSNLISTKGWKQCF